MICRVSMEAEMIFFCVYTELRIIWLRISSDFWHSSFIQCVFYWILLVQDANLVFFSKIKRWKKKEKKMPFKASLDDLEWKVFFFFFEPWWATLVLLLFSLGKLTNHFWKVKANPEVFRLFSDRNFFWHLILNL